MRDHIRNFLYRNREMVVGWTVGVWEHTGQLTRSSNGLSPETKTNAQRILLMSHLLRSPWYQIVGASRTVCNRESRYTRPPLHFSPGLPRPRRMLRPTHSLRPTLLPTPTPVSHPTDLSRPALLPRPKFFCSASHFCPTLHFCRALHICPSFHICPDLHLYPAVHICPT